MIHMHPPEVYVHKNVMHSPHARERLARILREARGDLVDVAGGNS